MSSEAVNTNFLKSFVLTRPGNRTKYETDALTTRPRAGIKFYIIRILNML